MDRKSPGDTVVVELVRDGGSSTEVQATLTTA